MAKSKVGGWLIVGALALTLLAYWLWSNETERVERERRVEGFTAAIAGRPDHDIDEDRTAPLTAAGTAAVLFLGGVILVAAKND